MDTRSEVGAGLEESVRQGLHFRTEFTLVLCGGVCFAKKDGIEIKTSDFFLGGEGG